MWRPPRANLFEMRLSGSASIVAMKTGVASLVALAVLGAAGALAQVYHWPQVADDTFIFLRYAENLASGAGPVWNAGGTPVAAPLDAVVHSFADNDRLGDYGPTVILEHALDDVTFYTLHGHLNRESLEPLDEGLEFAAGEPIGFVGEHHEKVPIIAAGGIEDPEHIRVGEKLFIPGVLKARNIGPTNGQPSAKSDNTAIKKDLSAAKSPTPETPKSQKTSLRFIWPVKGSVTSWFGVRKGRRHDGIDIAAPKGTPIRASETGKVIYSGNGIAGYGNLIIIQHLEGFNSVYAHNSKNLVKVDENVKKKQIIGKVGDTGRARGYHLHFEIRRGVRSVDPMHYLP